MQYEGRAKLVGLGILFVLAGVIVAVLAMVQPARSARAGATSLASLPPAAASLSAGSALPGADPEASPTDATQRPALRPSPADRVDPARAVASAGTSAGTSAGPTIAASGGGPGARVEDLSALAPVQAFNVSGVRNGPVRIGAVTYADSVRFTCDSGGHDSSGDLDYVVTGYGSMSAMIGVPSDDTRAAGDTMTVSFFNNGSGSQTSRPLTISPGQPQRVRLTFRGSSQLEISCSAVNATTQSPEYMDLALANATIGP